MRKLATAMAAGLMMFINVEYLAAQTQPVVNTADFSPIILNELVPEKYLAPAQQSGRVERVDYDTFFYAHDIPNNLQREQWHPIRKTAYVYLPYGYDETRQYDVFYLLHGGGGNQTNWFGTTVSRELVLDEHVFGRDLVGLTAETTQLEPGQGDIVRILDNLIAEGRIKPLIVVTPTMYYRGDDLDIDVAGDISTDHTDNFALEFRNDLMPVIESRYSTYAEDTTEEAFIASRDHRAFAGLSMGAMVTWRSGLQQSLPYVSWIAPYSGGVNPGPIPETFRETGKLWDAIDEQIEQYPINALLNFNGTSDIAHDPHVVTYHHLLGLSDGHLVDGQNAAYFDYEQWIHGWYTWITYFYNSTLVFFQ